MRSRSGARTRASCSTRAHPRPSPSSTTSSRTSTCGAASASRRSRPSCARSLASRPYGARTTSDRWFSYPYWLDDARAPDFARTVDIHRKPGYDPVELFLDPMLAAPKLKIAMTLLRRKLGFRALLDVIGLDTSLVKGSHGRLTESPDEGPVFITSEPTALPPGDTIAATQVKQAVLSHVFGA